MNDFNGEHESNIWRVFAKLYAQIDFTRNLYWRTEFGYDFTNQLEERFSGSLTQEASTNGFGDALDQKEKFRD